MNQLTAEDQAIFEKLGMPTGQDFWSRSADEHVMLRETIRDTHDEYPVCETCGSDDVRRDAWGEWDRDKGEWVLHSVYDDAWCENCEAECNTIAAYAPKPEPEKGTLHQLIKPEESNCEIDLDVVVWIEIPPRHEIKILSDEWRWGGTVSHNHTDGGPVPGTDFIVRSID